MGRKLYEDKYRRDIMAKRIIERMEKVVKDE